MKLLDELIVWNLNHLSTFVMEIVMMENPIVIYQSDDCNNNKHFVNYPNISTNLKEEVRQILWEEEDSLLLLPIVKIKHLSPISLSKSVILHNI